MKEARIAAGSFSWASPACSQASGKSHLSDPNYKGDGVHLNIRGHHHPYCQVCHAPTMGYERCRYALGGAVKGILFLDGLMAGIGGSPPVNVTKYWISCFKIVGVVR